MKKLKRTFHCERCGNPCTIYKKGKNHRVLVCPQHGVIATNPLPLLAMAAPAAISAVSGLLSKRETANVGTTGSACHHRESYSAEERVRDALI